MMQANRLYAKTKVGPASAARLESRFQVAWMKAARTTRASESGNMRPPCHSVDGTLISPGIRWDQSENLVLQVRHRRIRPPDPAAAVRNLGPIPCAPWA